MNFVCCSKVCFQLNQTKRNVMHENHEIYINNLLINLNGIVFAVDYKIILSKVLRGLRSYANLDALHLPQSTYSVPT